MPIRQHYFTAPNTARLSLKPRVFRAMSYVGVLSAFAVIGSLLGWR